MDRRQIKELIPALYNISSDQTSDKCTNETCIYGKCICMDTEQLELLQGILIKEDFVSMDIRDGRCLFRNLQQGVARDRRCPLAVQGSLSEGLIPYRDLTAMDQLDSMIEHAVQGGQADFADMLGSVPAVYMINSSRETKDRESLVNLCVYASCPQRYLDQLLRAVICYTIACYKKMDPGKWGEYTQKIAELFDSLNKMFENSGEQIEELLEVMDLYYNKLGEKGGRIHFAQNMLGECRDRMRNVRDRKLAVCEGEKSRQWYRILKKIFQIMGMSVKAFPELTFVDSRKQPSDYDDIIRILDSVKSDGQKARKVLDKVQTIFYRGLDITDEEVIQELERIAGA